MSAIGAQGFRQNHLPEKSSFYQFSEPHTLYPIEHDLLAHGCRFPLAFQPLPSPFSEEALLKGFIFELSSSWANRVGWMLLEEELSVVLAQLLQSVRPEDRKPHICQGHGDWIVLCCPWQQVLRLLLLWLCQACVGELLHFLWGLRVCGFFLLCTWSGNFLFWQYSHVCARTRARTHTHTHTHTHKQSLSEAWLTCEYVSLPVDVGELLEHCLVVWVWAIEFWIYRSVRKLRSYGGNNTQLELET